jgi:hypothetical protein
VKLSRRTTAVAAIAGAAAFALIATGCSAGGTPAADSSKPITLTLATFNNFGYDDALLAEYHKLHPNITVVQNKAATSDAAQTNLFTKLAAGSGLGDVEAVDGDWMPKVRKYANKFVDLASRRPPAASPAESRSDSAQTSARRQSATARTSSRRPACRPIQPPSPSSSPAAGTPITRSARPSPMPRPVPPGSTRPEPPSRVSPTSTRISTRRTTARSSPPPTPTSRRPSSRC